MNLRALTSGIVAAINPLTAAMILPSAGATDAGAGKRVPSYGPAVAARAQVQALTFRDLQQIEGLNLQGTRRAIYLYGQFDGVVRPLAKGGDLVQVASGVHAGTWLVAIVLEQWPDWCKVAVTLQNGS